ncbi:hypothetical protein KC711_05940 [Candidatus Peregrinibacteria bacterium]|nr:hypothetical protein [Candidatus Peregrinibacteria bacterium]
MAKVISEVERVAENEADLTYNSDDPLDTVERKLHHSCGILVANQQHPQVKSYVQQLLAGFRDSPVRVFQRALGNLDSITNATWKQAQQDLKFFLREQKSKETKRSLMAPFARYMGNTTIGLHSFLVDTFALFSILCYTESNFSNLYMNLPEILLIVQIVALSIISMLVALILFRIYEIIARIEVTSRNLNTINRILLKTQNFSISDLLIDIKHFFR